MKAINIFLTIRRELDNLYKQDLKSNRKGYNLFLDEYHRKHNYIDYNEIQLNNYGTHYITPSSCNNFSEKKILTNT